MERIFTMCMGGLLAMLVFSASVPIAAVATDGVMEADHIRVGLVDERGLDGSCGVELYFSRDFKAKRYAKYAFKMGAVRSDRADGHAQWHEYAVMHLDGKDRIFEQHLLRAHAANGGIAAYELLEFTGADYRLSIKWLPFDICHATTNEDCEVEGLRAYLTIRRGDTLRHLRLFGIRGC